MAIKDEKLKKDLLPHLYGFPFYKWAYDFFWDFSPNAFLCAANQISKSTTLQRKTINLATDPKLWPKIWGTPPREYWYMYPNFDFATNEFKLKWIPDILPRGEYIDHPTFGWKAFYERGKIHRVEFNSGIILFFKSYEQKVSAVQGSTVHFIACDEELPRQFWNEVNARRFACDGLFNMVFTATLGQKFWYETIECRGKENERFKSAFKLQVSMYDCLKYHKSRKKTPWTIEKIKQVEDSCESRNEVLRRVHGRFILNEKQVFSAFEKSKIIHSEQEIKNLAASHDKHVAVFIRDDTAAFCYFSVSEDRKFAVIHDFDFDRGSTTEIYTAYKNFVKKGKKKPFLKFVNKGQGAFSAVAEGGGDFFWETKPAKRDNFSTINALMATQRFFVRDGPGIEEFTVQCETFKHSDHEDREFAEYEIIGAVVTGLSHFKLSFEPMIVKPQEENFMSERERMRRGLLKKAVIDTYENEFDEFNKLIEDYHESNFC